MPLLARRAASATERTLVYFRMNMYIRPPMRLSSSPTHQSISGRCWTRAYFRGGSKTVLTPLKWDVCITPAGSRHRSAIHAQALLRNAAGPYKVPNAEVLASLGEQLVARGRR